MHLDDDTVGEGDLPGSGNRVGAQASCRWSPPKHSATELRPTVETLPRGGRVRCHPRGQPEQPPTWLLLALDWLYRFQKAIQARGRVVIGKFSVGAGVQHRKPLGPLDGLTSQRHVGSAVETLALRSVMLAAETPTIIVVDPALVVGVVAYQPQLEAGVGDSHVDAVVTRHLHRFVQPIVPRRRFYVEHVPVLRDPVA